MHLQLGRLHLKGVSGVEYGLKHLPKHAARMSFHPSRSEFASG